jgi:hypothetical protein
MGRESYEIKELGFTPVPHMAYFPEERVDRPTGTDMDQETVRIPRTNPECLLKELRVERCACSPWHTPCSPYMARALENIHTTWLIPFAHYYSGCPRKSFDHPCRKD